MTISAKKKEIFGWPVPADNVLKLVGNTPLLQLKGERIFAKAEFLNPGGSIKERMAPGLQKNGLRPGGRKEEF